MRTGARPARVLAVRVFAAALLGGCASPTATPVAESAPASVEAPRASASPVGPPVTMLPSPGASSVASAAASPAQSPGPTGDTVRRDDSLLAILPPSIEDQPVTVEEESFAEAARDPAFARTVKRAAFALVVSPTDLASGVVAELREGVFSDVFFGDWRDTYNEGACAQAGGVTGNAEAELGGRTVYITSCEGGIRVYHAWVPERGVIVSLLSLGEARYGEQIMKGLRP